MSGIKIKFKPLDSAYLIRILISHPMETGRRKDKDSGEIIPAHFIEEVNIELNGEVVANVQFGTAVSRDPYLSFRLREAKPGDKVQVRWLDNQGLSDSMETQIP